MCVIKFTASYLSECKCESPQRRLWGSCVKPWWSYPWDQTPRLPGTAWSYLTLTAGSGDSLLEGREHPEALSTMVMVFRENILASSFWWCLLPKFVILLILLQGVCIISHPCIWWWVLKPFLLGMYCSQSGHVYDFSSICIWLCLLKPLLLGI